MRQRRSGWVTSLIATATELSNNQVYSKQRIQQKQEVVQRIHKLQ